MILNRAMPRWEIIEGVSLARMLEMCLNGTYHVALTGSVLYFGSSDNDLDLVIYSHDNGPVNIEELINLLIPTVFSVEHVSSGSRYPRTVIHCVVNTKIVHLMLA